MENKLNKKEAKKKDYKREACDFFSNDLFATKTSGIIIEEVSENYAKCSMNITANHMNAAGVVMGGALFTLADFTFAIAANTESLGAVSLNSQINFMRATKAAVLYGEAKCIKKGKTVSFYEVNIFDDDDNLIAIVNTTSYRHGK